MSSPVFPITVHFQEDSTSWVLDNESQLATSLEWFDSRDEREHAHIFDANGRLVRLKVERLKILEFYLEE